MVRKSRDLKSNGLDEGNGRVFEANRNVFLYPENWIESEGYTILGQFLNISRGRKLLSPAIEKFYQTYEYSSNIPFYGYKYYTRLLDFNKKEVFFNW